MTVVKFILGVFFFFFLPRRSSMQYPNQGIKPVLPALVAWTPERNPKFILEEKIDCKSLGEFLALYGEPQWAKQKWVSV